MKPQPDCMALLGEFLEHRRLLSDRILHLCIATDAAARIPGAVLRNVLDRHRGAAVSEHQNPVLLDGFARQLKHWATDEHQRQEQQGKSHARENAAADAVAEEPAVTPDREESDHDEQHRPHPARPRVFPGQTQIALGSLWDHLNVKQPSDQIAIHAVACGGVVEVWGPRPKSGDLREAPWSSPRPAVSTLRSAWLNHRASTVSSSSSSRTATSRYPAMGEPLTPSPNVAAKSRESNVLHGPEARSQDSTAAVVCTLVEPAAGSTFTASLEIG